MSPLIMSPSSGLSQRTAELNTKYDVDSRTGFMASQVPVRRLPQPWESWEVLLDSAVNGKFQPGDSLNLSLEDARRSQSWRASVRESAIIPTYELNNSDTLLRRAHLVLTFLLHFYVQSLPPDAPIVIPKPISTPLLHVSATLDMPPVVTLSDTVLYNWDFKSSSDSLSPIDLDNLCCQTLFSGLKDEEEFYLSSARIEIRGVEALELMHLIGDDIRSSMPLPSSTSSPLSSSPSINDDVSQFGTKTSPKNLIMSSTPLGRVRDHLSQLAVVVNDLKRLLLDVQNGCDPTAYYNVVRPWFRGEDSDEKKRKWVFEGLDELLGAGTLAKSPTELSGASAGQSSLIHTLDIFLGVDNRRPVPSKSNAESEPSFLERMKSYMPRKHRLFLDDLASWKPSLREFVLEMGDDSLSAAYNKAVIALKEFRDSHMIIVALYIIGPAHRAAEAARQKREGVVDVPAMDKASLKGTGGTDLAMFLKGVRNQTAGAVVETVHT
ncbi:hypothetical protein D9758_014276 [Tetrapyrgos nigripes]|uniref:Indoleamine 2,3-dioxygenase n=1 Tax=Tetrapyrgos nigripes TaxID=182062 RepID=A0A8H5C4J3_9AGAR|nr:hypothetical protein D9758_014276 [Tetrapyrgos nigripes]